MIMRRHILLLLICGLSAIAFAQSSTYSYVMSRTKTDTGTNAWLDHIDYDNGLGDVYQQVDVDITPGGNSLVTVHEYDEHRRPLRTWLPASFSGSGIQNANSIKTGSQTLNLNDSKPYTWEKYEPSPLNRLTEKYGPGNDWHQNNKRQYIQRYLDGSSNPEGNALILTMNQNTLLFSTSTSIKKYMIENVSDEDGHKTITFTDKNGQVAAVRNFKWPDYNTTYYAYDDFGDLRFVMPPTVAYYYESNSGASFSAASTQMLQYGYEYRYDSRHNCIYKRLPGCDPVYYVYDKAGRCILSQDGVQRNNGVWSFSIPDVYGRTVLTGTCTNSIVYTSEPLKNVVVKAFRTTPSGSIYGYSVSGFSPSLQSVYSVNYYDDYSFVGNGLTPTSLAYTTPPTGDYGSQGLTSPRGLLTGTAVGRITSSGVSGMNYTAIYYDDKGRIIQTRGTNHMGGTDYEYTGYTYTDKVQKRQHVHMASGMATQTETYTYEYDSADRLKKTKHKLNTNSEVTLHQYTYNELGQMTQKTNGGISSAAETYTYNVRSWLKTISSTLFNETLYYNDTYGGSTAQYGGNVSAMTWKADNNTRGYKFTYDNFSRLTKAQYMSNGNTSSYYTAEYTYDRMGNMLTLKRNGMMNSTAFPPIDYLTFTYSGNQVTRIDDSGYTPTYTGAFNFMNGASQSNEYTYDKNGNLTKDLNKNISSIQYNFLNLPANITYSSGKSAAYIYDANGQKLRTSYKASASATAVPTDYCGNMIYENGVLKQVLVDGGYMTVTGTPFYFYYLKDHLGNNRVVVSPAGTATQINHYYPFGGLFGESTGNTGQRYKYNGKEFDRTHGLDWYDYGARHMSPDVGRFTTIDPMAEKYYNISPYAYCANNPMNIIDPTGMIWENPEEAKELENNIEDRISSLNKNIQKLEMKILRGGLSEKKTSKYNDKIEDLREQISNLNQSIEDIHLLGKDSHIYAFANVDGGRHSVYNSDGKIYIERSSDAFAIHEITHIRQSLMSGGLSFNSSGYLLNIGSPKNYQMMADTEIEAYQKQYSYDNSFPGQVHSLHSINLKSVGNIRDEKGGIVYNSIYNYYKYLQTVNKLMGK